MPINSIYVDWHNRFISEQADSLAGQLKQLGVDVRIAHYTGDSSFPTEYTISIAGAHGMGPTFDMALMDFIGKMLKFMNTPAESERK